jgi:hypothetical protein
MRRVDQIWPNFIVNFTIEDPKIKFGHVKSLLYMREFSFLKMAELGKLF